MRWEYMVADMHYEPQRTPNVLEAAGREGWEAVGMSVRETIVGPHLVVLFKRQVQA